MHCLSVVRMVSCPGRTVKPTVSICSVNLLTRTKTLVFPAFNKGINYTIVYTVTRLCLSQKLFHVVGPRVSQKRIQRKSTKSTLVIKTIAILNNLFVCLSL